MKGNDVVLSRGWNGWPTPLDLFEQLNSVFHFDIDLAANKDNTLCEHYFSEDDDSLLENWTDLTGFLNPPYNIGRDFVEKCIAENDNAKLVCLLIPARVDTRWFHFVPEGIWCFFFKGRLKFGRLEKNSPAPFPSCLLLFGQDRDIAKAKLNTILKNKGRWVLL